MQQPAQTAYNSLFIHHHNPFNTTKRDMFYILDMATWANRMMTCRETHSTLHKILRKERVESDTNGRELRPARATTSGQKEAPKNCGLAWLPVSRRQKGEEHVCHHKNRQRSNIAVAMQNCEAVAIGLSIKSTLHCLRSSRFSGHKIRYDLQQPVHPSQVQAKLANPLFRRGKHVRQNSKCSR